MSHHGLIANLQNNVPDIFMRHVWDESDKAVYRALLELAWSGAYVNMNETTIEGKPISQLCAEYGIYSRADHVQLHMRRLYVPIYAVHTNMPDLVPTALSR